MKFSLTILGSNSAVPAHNRFPTAQILQHHDQRMLIDCGEGAQFQLNKYKIKQPCATTKTFSRSAILNRYVSIKCCTRLF